MFLNTVYFNLYQLCNIFCLKYCKRGLFFTKVTDSIVLRDAKACTFTLPLRSYGVVHMVKDHSDSERGNLLPPHGLLFPICQQGFFYVNHPSDGMAHITACVTPIVKQLNGFTMRDRSDDPSHHERMLYHGAKSRFLFAICLFRSEM